MLKPFPQNPFKDMKPAQLRKERPKRLASLYELELRMKDEDSFTKLRPTQERLEAENRQIKATLNK